MLARQRQAYILERVREDGGVRVADLVRELGVSDMTIRRDLEFLHDRGLIEKVHGGAAAVPGSALFEPGFAAKSALQRAEKEAIAEAAAGLVQPGTAIGISAGTTTHAIARRLIDVIALTVVTNSVPVADVFHDAGRSDQTIILTGGVRTPSNALVGPFAVAALRSVHLDLVFLGVHGMDPLAGFTSPNLLEAETDRALIEAGRRLVVVADHTKWGLVGLSSIAQLDQADVLITDASLEPAAREALSSHIAEVLVVEPRQEFGHANATEGRQVSDASSTNVPSATLSDGRAGGRSRWRGPRLVADAMTPSVGGSVRGPGVGDMPARDGERQRSAGSDRMFEA